jgi:hypothetical protein
VPASLKAPLRPLKHLEHRVTQRSRPLPDFLIIGAMKCGTTSLYAYLGLHPSIVRAEEKELRYFDLHYGRGPAWYRAQFPTERLLERTGRRLGGRALTGEGCPDYLVHPLAPYRVRGLLPDVRMIVLLREPVERAISHHNHMVDVGIEDLPFEEAIEREPERLARDLARLDRFPLHRCEEFLNYSYLARGRYAEQLEVWFSAFHRDQFLIMDSESLFADTEATLARACEFLGLPAHRLPSYQPLGVRSYDTIDPELRRRLGEHFAPHHDRLWELIGEQFDWGSQAG